MYLSLSVGQGYSCQDRKKKKEKMKLCGIDLTERVVRVVWACSVSGGTASTTRLAVVKPLTLAVTLSIIFLFEGLVIPTALQECLVSVVPYDRVETGNYFICQPCLFSKGLEVRRKRSCDGRHEVRRKRSCDGRLEVRRKRSCDGRLEVRRKRSCDGRLEVRRKRSCDGRLEVRRKRSCDGRLEVRRKRSCD